MSDIRAPLQAALGREFAAHGAEVVIEDEVLRLRDWPHARLEIGRIVVHSEDVVEAGLWFTVDAQDPSAKLYCPTVGVAEGLDAAIADAAYQWMHHVAPPLLSTLIRRAVLGAAWLAAGDPYGFATWNCFAGPLAFRADLGFATSKDDVVSPLTFLRDEVEAKLDPAKAYQSVLLYVGRAGDEVNSEVRVGLVPYWAIAHRLHNLVLPRPIGQSVSVRQFAVAIRPPVSQPG